MANLILDIWVDDCNNIHIEEEMQQPKDSHRARTDDMVRWKRKNVGHKPFEKWVVQLKQDDGSSLPPTDSPFQSSQVEFTGLQGAPEGDLVTTERDQMLAYSVACYAEVADTVPFAVRDPILVINDPGRSLRDEVEAISLRLGSIERLLTTMSAQLSELITAINSPG